MPPVVAEIKRSGCAQFIAFLQSSALENILKGILFSSFVINVKEKLSIVINGFYTPGIVNHLLVISR